METYDKEKIGKCIAWGGDHFVYNYGSSEVIKFSIFDFLNGDHIKASRDYGICRRYFGQYLLETKFALSPKGNYASKIQPKIKGRYLSKNDLADLAVRSQFEEIAAAYYSMLEVENSVIDLIGGRGVLRDCLSNIFITEDRKLFIIDATLVTTHDLRSNLLKLIFYPARPFLIWRQDKIISSLKK